MGWGGFQNTPTVLSMQVVRGNRMFEGSLGWGSALRSFLSFLLISLFHPLWGLQSPGLGWEVSSTFPLSLLSFLSSPLLARLSFLFFSSTLMSVHPAVVGLICRLIKNYIRPKARDLSIPNQLKLVHPPSSAVVTYVVGGGLGKAKDAS